MTDTEHSTTSCSNEVVVIIKTLIIITIIKILLFKHLASEAYLFTTINVIKLVALNKCLIIITKNVKSKFKLSTA